MKAHHLLFVSLLIISCQEKTFADDITLVYPKNTKMKIQEFNEDGNLGGDNLIYVGKIIPKINIQYYDSILPEPPPPPKKNNEIDKSFNERNKKEIDSIYLSKKTYFKRNLLKINFSKENEPYDSLTNKNLQIIVKQKDTIPIYKQDYITHQFKTFKAFPVFIKNISNKTIKIPTESRSVAFYAFNNERKNFYYLRNSNYKVFGLETYFYSYFELKPNEILVYAYPYFKKGKTHKAKVKFYDASSKEFDISIDDNIIENQMETFFIK
jgi:hypothetical protein